MRARVTKLFEFEAAHCLPGHIGPDGEPGKCSRPHGHSYKLEVTLYAPVVNEPGFDLPGFECASDHGFVMDFYWLSRKVKELIVDVYDHQDLNQLLPFRTTAELMAFYFMGLLLEGGLPIERVRLYETRTGYAEIHVEDFDQIEFEGLRRGIPQYWGR